MEAFLQERLSCSSAHVCVLLSAVLLKTSENPTLKSTLWRFWRYAVCSYVLLSLLHSLPSFPALRFRGKLKHPNSSAQDALAA